MTYLWGSLIARLQTYWLRILGTQCKIFTITQNVGTSNWINVFKVITWIDRLSKYPEAMTESDPKSLLAIFWDIENCGVPRGKSVIAVAQCIRYAFLTPYLKEAEFLCVCDVMKEPATLISDLNDAQVCHSCLLLNTVRWYHIC